MAKKVKVVHVDDLNGEPADTTIRFGLDAREYELDLTEGNAQELRELFARYISAARKVSGRRRSAAAADRPAFTAVDPAAVRAWAKGKGIEVSPRGRLKADLRQAYRAADNWPTSLVRGAGSRAGSGASGDFEDPVQPNPVAAA